MVGAKIPCADPKTRFITKKTVRTASDRSAREASDSGAQGIKLPPAAGGSAPYGAIGVEVRQVYELDRYIMLIRHTGFNPFRLAAAYASCSPPSPASGDGYYDDRAYSRHLILSN